MISNSRQASVSKKRREELLRAAKEAPPGRRSTYLQLADQIGRELEEYDKIRHGVINEFSVREIDDLGEVLIKARLAKGWTQRQLAEELHVSEQMVQKDESRAYENAGLSRIAEVADVLGYNLQGSFRPVRRSTDLWRSQITSVSIATAFPLEATYSWALPTHVRAVSRIPVGWTGSGYVPSGGILGTQSIGSEFFRFRPYIDQTSTGVASIHVLDPVSAVYVGVNLTSTTAVPIEETSGAAQ
jgi:transcriptional regulator with XRE-family HTH domain